MRSWQTRVHHQWYALQCWCWTDHSTGHRTPQSSAGKGHSKGRGKPPLGFCCATHINQIWHNCCFMVNYQGPMFLEQWMYIDYSTGQKSGDIFVMFLKEVSYAHLTCIYLIKNTEKKKQWYCEILIQFKWMVFYLNILPNIIYFWCKSEFSSAITPVFSVTWSFRNHTYLYIISTDPSDFQLHVGASSLQFTPLIFYRVQVRGLGRPWQKLHSVLSDTFLCWFWYLFWITVLMDDPTTAHYWICSRSGQVLIFLSVGIW